MYSDRRQQPRKVPKGFAFIQVERDDGGRVLNISEDGLCFEVFSTLHASQSLRFWFTFDLRERIEALGRLVWMDATNGIGGLSFTSLSQSARDRIRAWVGNLATDEDAIETPEPAPAQALREPVVRAVELKPVEPLKWPAPSLETISFNSAAALRGTAPTVEAHSEYPSSTELVPLERHRSVTRTYFMRGFVVGIIVPTAVAALLFRYADAARHSLASPEPSVQAAAAAPEAETQSKPQTVQTKTQLATTSSFAPSYSAKSQHLSPSNYSSASPFAGPAAKYNVPSSAATSHRTQAADPPTASQAAVTKKTTASPTQLWAQVHAGSSKAAVELAELYIHGSGVPLNCDQARILLLVASEKNNKEAIQRLRDLDKTGCPLPQS